MSDVTRIFDRVQQGDPKAADELLPLVYQESRKLAAHRMAREAPEQTFQPTALVHEAWLKPVGKYDPTSEGRAHFFAAAADALRKLAPKRRREAGSLLDDATPKDSSTESKFWCEPTR
jgi:hypothetical protein